MEDLRQAGDRDRQGSQVFGSGQKVFAQGRGSEFGGHVFPSAPRGIS